MIYSKGAATVTVLSTNPHIYFEYFGPYAVPIEYNRRSFFSKQNMDEGRRYYIKSTRIWYSPLFVFDDPHSFQVKHVTQTIIRKWVIACR